MTSKIFWIFLLSLYFPVVSYADHSNTFDTAFKQWITENSWGTDVCQLSKEQMNAMFFEYMNANKIVSSFGTKCSAKKHTQNTSSTEDTTALPIIEQPVLNIDIKKHTHTFEPSTTNITNETSPTEMSTTEACKYWNGTMSSDGKCTGTSGMLWVTQWDDTTKSFSCILKVVDFQQKHPDQTKLINMYREETYDASGRPYDFVSDLQWDKDLQKCTSAPERKCIQDGNTYDSSDNICLSHKQDQEKCKAVGGIYSNKNGKSSCDCTIGDKSFHWDSGGTCEYISGTYSKSKTQSFESYNSKYAEYCIYRQLIKTDLFNGTIKELGCTNK